MKKSILSLAIAALALGAGATHAKNEKHGYYVHGPRYIAPAPVYRPYAPVHHRGHRYHDHHRGYWRNGRWVAPVVVGATIGALAVAASTPVYSAPVYSAPVYHAPVNYYTPGDRFSWADVNNDGYLSYHESRRFGGLNRNFAAIDWNGDGYLSRDEVNNWRHGW
ncbi:MAG: hypothetical protein ACRDAM_11555 [Casimicrobium sp.]